MFRIVLLTVLIFIQGAYAFAAADSSDSFESVDITKSYPTIGQFSFYLKEEGEVLNLKQARDAFKQGGGINRNRISLFLR